MAVALTAAVAVRLGVNALAAAQAMAELEADPESWGGVGTAILGATVGLLLGFVVAVAGVGVGVRGRDRSGRFTVVFVAALVAALIVQSAFSGPLGAIALPRLGDTGWLVLVLACPLLWALPAAAVGALRWRWLALIVALVVGAAAVTAWVSNATSSLG